MVGLKGVVGVICLLVLAAPVLAQDLRPKPRPPGIDRTATDPHAPVSDVAAQTQGLPFVFAAAQPAAQPAARPVARFDKPAEGGIAPAVPELALPLGDAAPSPRPRPRPAALMRAAAPAQALALPEAALQMVSLRPRARPDSLARTNRPAAPERVQTAAAIVRPAPGTGPIAGPKGSVCGNPAIQGQRLSPIAGRIAGCGIKEPVRITSVAGVRLTQPATVNCATAQAFTAWVERGLKPAFGGTGGGVVALTVPAHYACRTQNHRRGAKLSEHAKGNAVDISVIHLANGRQVPVLRSFRGEYAQQMRAAHRAACGIFGTTLGPGSDGMHEDHFHYDVARHRNGPYCR